MAGKMAALSRFDRVTAILIQLQTRRTTKAQDLAGRFGVSLRTIYRDIRSLEAAGVPLYGEPGLGYSLVDGYRLPPVMFTREEAASLVTAGKLVEKLTGSQTLSDYKGALYKVKAVLGAMDKEFLEGLETSMAVRGGAPSKEPERPDSLPAILRSLADRTVLALEYRSPRQPGTTRRKVEPVGVFFDHARWHLIAYCRMRKDYRDFRLDRIAALAPLGETFPKRHPPLEQLLDRVDPDRTLEPVTLSVSGEAADYLKDSRYHRGFVSEAGTGKDGWIEMSFLTSSLESFAHWYATFAEHARIIRPPALRERVKSLLARKSLHL